MYSYRYAYLDIHAHALLHMLEHCSCVIVSRVYQSELVVVQARASEMLASPIRTSTYRIAPIDMCIICMILIIWLIINMCVYICIYIHLIIIIVVIKLYMYIYIYIYMYIHIHIYTHMYMHTHMTMLCNALSAAAPPSPLDQHQV